MSHPIQSRALPTPMTKVMMGAAAIACALFAVTGAARPVFAQSQAQTQADSPNVGPTTPVEDALNIWEKRLVQEGLILLGDYNGFADGVFGSGTHDAIAAFQVKHGRRGDGRLTGADALDLAGTALALRKTLEWRPLKTSTGISMSYPAALLVKSKPSNNGGETIDSADGDVSLMTVHIARAKPDGIDLLFASLSDGSKETVTYKFQRPSLFILSGKRQGNTYYTRMEQRGDDIRGYELVWKPDRDDIMKNISVLISNSFYPFGDNPGSNDGEASFPVLARLAKQSAPDTRRQADTNPPANRETQPSQNDNSQQGSSQAEGVTEQKDGALPPPTDGSLVTSDGKGLRFTYQYLPPDNADLRYAYRWAVDTHLFSNIPEIDALDGIFVTSRPLRYVTAQCGSVNAFYTKKHSAVVLCYEMIDSLRKMGETLAKGSTDPKALTVEFVKDNLRFILLHESGHALIDLLDLPAVGREEDSVDQLAAVLLFSRTSDSETENDIARVVQLAADWFKVNSADTQTKDLATYADEHGLDAQRYFNLLCFVYGRDPKHFHGIVQSGMLPSERANRCPEEAAKITRSWARLLLPHFSPRFKPKDAAEADDRGNGNMPTPRQSQARNPLEWDGKSNPFGN